MGFRCGVFGVEDEVADLGAGSDKGRVDLCLAASLAQVVYRFGEFPFNHVFIVAFAAQAARALVVRYFQANKNFFEDALAVALCVNSASLSQVFYALRFAPSQED
jgi:hypothetical protein